MVFKNPLWLAIALAFLSTTLTAQNQPNSNVASTLAAAKELSQATGRPIFAVAGRHT